MGDFSMDNILKDLKSNSLTELVIKSSNKIEEEGGKKIGEALKSNTSLTHLNIWNNLIGEEGGKKIGEALKSNTSLTHLNIGNNLIGEEGGKVIGKALQTNKSLTHLDIRGNEIGKEGGKKIGEALKTNTSLTHLNIGSNLIGEEGGKVIGEALRTTKSLTRLDIRNNLIGKEGGKMIGEALKRNTSLTYLTIYDNKIGEEGGKMIGEALKTNTSLTRLDIRSNKIGEEGGKMIGEALKTNTSLIYLTIWDNEIGKEGGKMIGEALKTNTSLTHLDIGNNQIGEEGGKMIGEALKSNTSLIHLDIGKIETELSPFFDSNCNRIWKRKIEIVVSGGGPVGLAFVLLCASRIPNSHIRVYETRWKRQNGRVVWEGNRRSQVVTIQDDVSKVIPELDKILFKNYNEAVWRNSRNIPIREVEDRLLERIQEYEFRGKIELINQRLDNTELERIKGTYEILVGADGRGRYSKEGEPLNTSSIFGFKTDSEGTEHGLGVPFFTDEPCQPQALNVFFTLAQTRYLLNCYRSKQGFLNIRLTKAEYDQLDPKDTKSASKAFQDPDSHIGKVIREGLAFFNIPESSVDVDGISNITIDVNRSYEFIKRETERFGKTTKMEGLREKPKICLIGDAAFQVHFWPGRGLNSGIKAAANLCSSIRRANRANQDEILENNLVEHEGKMNALRKREICGRSNEILRVIPKEIPPVPSGAKFMIDAINKVKRIRDRMMDDPEFACNHKAVTDKEIEDVFCRIELSTVNLINEWGGWPTREMGGPEVQFDNEPYNQ